MYPFHADSRVRSASCAECASGGGPERMTAHKHGDLQDSLAPPFLLLAGTARGALLALLLNPRTNLHLSLADTDRQPILSS